MRCGQGRVLPVFLDCDDLELASLFLFPFDHRFEPRVWSGPMVVVGGNIVDVVHGQFHPGCW